MSAEFNALQVPIFITSYNRLTHLRKLVDWLQSAEYENINIVDNASTYPPLLEYLKLCGHNVHRLEANMGHLAVWKCGLFESILTSRYYVVTDCDVLPSEECPLDVIDYFHRQLLRFDNYTKVGFSLRIDDLPDCYVFKEKVLALESKFWNSELVSGIMDAPIDTTFALYKPGIFPDDGRWWKALRTTEAYTARHLPWYDDSNNLSEEDLFYQKSLDGFSTDWSVTDVEILKEQNLKYRNSIRDMRNDMEYHRQNHQRLRDNYWRIHKSPSEFLKAIIRKIRS